MIPSNLQLRRATVDDLPKLIALWQRDNLAWETLEKRFKEFQVVENASGELVGALGLEITGTEGRLHDEVFARPEEADALRDLLWERVLVVGKNFGLVRVWSQFSTPFWNRCGFQFASEEVLAKLPPAFAGDPHPWRFQQLREEPAAALSLDREFAVFKEMERQATARTFQQAKILKIFAVVVVATVFLLILVLVITWFKARGQLPRADWRGVDAPLADS